MIRSLCFLVLFFVARAAVAQQDAQFTQYMFNGIYINPAYAGYKEQAYLHSFYRSQWTGFAGAPQTFSLAADMVSRDGNIGLGLLLLNDRLGAQSNFAGYLNYAYRLQVGSSDFSRLSFGIGGGLMQTGIDGRKLSAADPNDNYVPQGMSSQLLPDARAGIFFANERFYAGASVDNLVAGKLQSKRSASILTPKINPHYYLTAGALLNLSDDIKFKPSFLVKDDQLAPTSLDLNAFALFNERLWLGAFYRTAIRLYNKTAATGIDPQNATGLVAEIFATANLRIGYSFDYSLTRIGNYSYGSHELSIGLALGERRREGPKCYF